MFQIMIHLKMSELKKLSEIVFKGGPIYLKFQAYSKEWMKVYLKRNLKGDKNVVKFIKHFAEIDEKERI